MSHLKKYSKLHSQHLHGLIDWNPVEKTITIHCPHLLDTVKQPAYSRLLLFKMLQIKIWNGGLIDESVESMANSNLESVCDATSVLVTEYGA